MSFHEGPYEVMVRFAPRIDTADIVFAVAGAHVRHGVWKRDGDELRCIEEGAAVPAGSGADFPLTEALNKTIAEALAASAPVLADRERACQAEKDALGQIEDLTRQVTLLQGELADAQEKHKAQHRRAVEAEDEREKEKRRSAWARREKAIADVALIRLGKQDRAGFDRVMQMREAVAAEVQQVAEQAGEDVADRALERQQSSPA